MSDQTDLLPPRRSQGRLDRALAVMRFACAGGPVSSDLLPGLLEVATERAAKRLCADLVKRGDLVRVGGGGRGNRASFALPETGAGNGCRETTGFESKHGLAPVCETGTKLVPETVWGPVLGPVSTKGGEGGVASTSPTQARVFSTERRRNGERGVAVSGETARGGNGCQTGADGKGAQTGFTGADVNGAQTGFMARAISTLQGQVAALARSLEEARAEARAWGERLLLEAADKGGIVHRDVKPANVPIVEPIAEGSVALDDPEALVRAERILAAGGSGPQQIQRDMLAFRLHPPELLHSAVASVLLAAARRGAAVKHPVRLLMWLVKKGGGYELGHDEPWDVVDRQVEALTKERLGVEAEAEAERRKAEAFERAREERTSKAAATREQLEARRAETERASAAHLKAEVERMREVKAKRAAEEAAARGRDAKPADVVVAGGAP